MKDNIDLIADFYAQEDSNISSSQSAIEVISSFFGRPFYLSVLIIFACGWIVMNLYADRFGINQFDPSPYVGLQGIVGFNGVVITIAVLVRQNRMEKLAEKRAHLNLQTSLLAEQKATKIIQLLEELRMDLPNVKQRQNPDIEEMKIETDAHAVLNAIDAQQSEKKPH